MDAHRLHRDEKNTAAVGRPRAAGGHPRGEARHGVPERRLEGMFSSGAVIRTIPLLVALIVALE